MHAIILIVLDGFGMAPPGQGNGVYLAHPKNIDYFLYSYPHTQLKAWGEAVGLPAKEVGNTEVGHLNLGAGRIVYQSLPRINMSIADGSFYENKVFLDALDHLNKTNGKLHLIGLVGEGSVHATIEHLYAILFFCKVNHFRRVYIHAITDGRDSPPRAAKIYLNELQQQLEKLGFGEIATVMGRFYAMDRDRRWERTERAYLCLTKGGERQSSSWNEAINMSYKRNQTDEFIEPTNIIKDGKPVALIEKNDAVIFYNYRIDRPRQLTKAFVLANFEKDANKTSYDPYATKYYKKHLLDEQVLNPPFRREEKLKNLYFATMTEYESHLPVAVAFPPTIVKIPLGRVLSEHGIYQLRVAESEKERFVTFYFNGLRESPFPFEDRLIVPSPKVPTYDLRPEMAAYEITDLLIRELYKEKHKFVLVNFANPDMVAHTGNIQAAVRAVQVIDECLEKIVNVNLDLNNTVIITADHGNIEEMIDLKTGQITTDHNDSPVPFIIINNKLQGNQTELQKGILADVAPTILALMEIEKPSGMTGRNLLEELREKGIEY